MALHEVCIEDCLRLRRQSPLIHNVTNYVAMNFTANALLAVGASPFMSSEPDEVREIVDLADALVVNVGCLGTEQARAMYLAVEEAVLKGKPWVLDPAGVGLSCLRTSTVLDLISRFHPSVIRGNASEIAFLSGTGNAPRGMDSKLDSASVVDGAVTFARKSGSVISVSGSVDYVTDGNEIREIRGGSTLMKRVTAMGCTASALTGAFLAVNGNFLEAASHAAELMSEAGSIAAAGEPGPGTFAVKFIDALAALSVEVGK
ncbi:MAG: hydroxyethylthiazole kinase [Bacteroidales bacterium]|nr:hydroxyethylthiazole kinase [Bacteroidales bacterium]